MLLLPGDGIGPEVTAEAVRVLRAVEARRGLRFHFSEGLIGGAALEATGEPLPRQTLQACAAAEAVFLGAVGGPQWDDLPSERRPERGLLALRRALGVFANLRPARVFPGAAEVSPLRPERAAGMDLVIVRELTGGLYFGEPRGRTGDQAVDTLRYGREEVARVARVAFQQARTRRGQVTSVDKANVLASSQLWRAVVQEEARAFPDVALRHMLVDTAAMELVRAPQQFDVLLTENMFGDILSDEAAGVVGSVGLLPSASLGARPPALYEPVHGSAPDIAGRQVANPVGAILSAALLLRYSCGLEEEAALVEEATSRVLAAGVRTPDLGGEATTMQVGERIAAMVREGGGGQ
ncbi:MAG: 3-isopropylmalate dehydrogenase [Armatimonadota bacterium]|nr:3-isopropylmalate dehydrogenase [Armatimonadota bacterium]